MHPTTRSNRVGSVRRSTSPKTRCPDELSRTKPTAPVAGQRVRRPSPTRHEAPVDQATGASSRAAGAIEIVDGSPSTGGGTPTRGVLRDGRRPAARGEGIWAAFGRVPGPCFRFHPRGIRNTGSATSLPKRRVEDEGRCSARRGASRSGIRRSSRLRFSCQEPPDTARERDPWGSAAGPLPRPAAQLPEPKAVSRSAAVPPGGDRSGAKTPTLVPSRRPVHVAVQSDNAGW